MLFNQYGYYIGPKFPAQMVTNLTSPGPADEWVEYWRAKLEFEVPRVPAINYLREFGAWTVTELEAMSDNELAEKVLWIAAGAVHFEGEWLGMVS